MTSDVMMKEGKKSSAVVRAFRCAGCRGAITDQYIFQVAPDLEWHGTCLRCCECQVQLDEQNTCFVRDGKTFCKADYLRLFGIKCFGCRLGFEMSDLVMKARHRIYHVDCFRCVVCRRRLVPGDEYAIADDQEAALFCRHDYDALEPCLGAAGTPSPSPPSPVNSAGGVNGGGERGVLTPIGRMIGEDENSRPTKTEPTDLSCSTICNGLVGSKVTTSRPTSDSSASSNRKNSDGTGSGSGSKSTSGGSSSSGHGSGGRTQKSDQRTTRVRTVLNEKQLHTLRTCYAANPRPDALMKDQLVEMTGLSARVIRVWFQNKRCKDKKRTILIKQIQQQQQEKLQGVPMIATSPVRHDPSQGISVTPVEVHHFIHRPPAQWRTPSPPTTCEAGIGDYPTPAQPTARPPLNGQISCDHLDPNQGHGHGQGQAPFQQLLSTFGESEEEDDDTVVSLEENSIFQSLHHLTQHHHHHPHHPLRLNGSGGIGIHPRLVTSRIGSEIQGHLAPFPASTCSPSASIGNHLLSTPPSIHPCTPTLQAFDAKC